MDRQDSAPDLNGPFGATNWARTELQAARNMSKNPGMCALRLLIKGGNWVWWHKPGIPAPRRLKQENGKPYLMKQNKIRIELGSSSMKKPVPSMYKALGSATRTKRRNKVMVWPMEVNPAYI